MMPIVIVAFLIQAGFWCVFAFGFRRAKRPRSSPVHPSQPVSVIVAARNEEACIRDLIKALDAQSYPAFEVLIVDDSSEDTTAMLIEEAAISRPWLRLIRHRIPAYPRKKTVLSVGVRAARNDILLFTDADCRPPPDWISLVAETHASLAEDIVVVGHAIFDRKPGLLNRFARFISLITTFQAAATIGIGMPFMAFGTNLSYRKRTFDRIGGFSAGLASLSGDDDLFVQHVHASGAARIVWMADPKSIVYTTSKETPAAWLIQKRRHASSARHFNAGVKIAGLLYWISLVSLFISPVLLGWSGLLWIVVWWFTTTFCVGNAFCILKGKDLILFAPVLLTLYMSFHTIMPVLGFLKPSTRWK